MIKLAAFGQHRNFNPRAPRGARQVMPTSSSMRAPFQSTCPARGTTHAGKRHVKLVAISIHVPREGHDTVV